MWKAKELKPDLIILDIGLPGQNGIEVARQILNAAPGTKILFVSQERSSDIVEAALRTGAYGYVIKANAGSELLRAVQMVLEGKRFISSDLAVLNLNPKEVRRGENFPELVPEQKVEQPHRHEVGFYSEDRRLLDDLMAFIGTALKSGNAAIVLATESHRRSLVQRLWAYGVNTEEVIERGCYITLDAAEALSTTMRDGALDPVRFVGTFTNLISKATKSAKRECPRVAIFGECVHLLWAAGNGEAAVEFEKLGNQLTGLYDVDILCGYSLSPSEMDTNLFQQICAEHSTVRANT